MSSPLQELPGVSAEDKRHKKPALPSYLSKLRNATFAFGRAADNDSNFEMRPLMGGGGGFGGDRMNMKRPAHANGGPGGSARGAPSTGYALPSLRSAGARYGSKLRKRHRDANDASGKTYRVNVLPQKFLMYFVCVFIGLPILLMLYLMARHAVFGDEGVLTDGHKYKYEVHRTQVMLSDTGEMSNGEGSSVVDTSENALNPDPTDGIHAVSGTGVDGFADSEIQSGGDKAIVGDSAGQNDKMQGSENQMNIGQEVNEVLSPGASPRQSESNPLGGEKSLRGHGTGAETPTAGGNQTPDGDGFQNKSLPKLPLGTSSEQSPASPNIDGTQSQNSPVAAAQNAVLSEVVDGSSQNTANIGVEVDKKSDRGKAKKVARQNEANDNPQRRTAEELDNRHRLRGR